MGRWYKKIDCDRKSITFIGKLFKYIEDIQIFLLNMTFISSSEVNNIHIL